jgi:O-glycosyl hydrolase
MASERVAGGPAIGPSVDGSEQVDVKRREALQRIGRFGAYTAPALLVILTSEKAVAADSLVR